VKNEKTIFFLLLMFLSVLLYPEGLMCFSKDYKILRSDMVITQIKERGITDQRILDAVLCSFRWRAKQSKKVRN